MDQQFLERERELFKLNAKLNAKSKKIAPSITTTTSTKAQIKTSIQIHTANNYFNYYEENHHHHHHQSTSDEQQQQQQQLLQQQQQHLELMCKKMSITNQPVKKPQEIVYPLFNRQTLKQQQQQQQTRRVDIHLPSGSLMSDGNENADDCDTKSIKTETAVESASFKNESLLTRHSDDTSAVPPAEPIQNMPPLPPRPNVTDIIPKCIEKKISNEGLLKYDYLLCYT